MYVLAKGAYLLGRVISDHPNFLWQGRFFFILWNIRYCSTKEVKICDKLIKEHYFYKIFSIFNYYNVESMKVLEMRAASLLSSLAYEYAHGVDVHITVNWRKASSIKDIADILDFSLLLW